MGYHILLHIRYIFFPIKISKNHTASYKLKVNNRSYKFGVTCPVTSESIKQVQCFKIKLTMFWEKLFMQLGYWEIDRKQNSCLSNTYLAFFISETICHKASSFVVDMLRIILQYTMLSLVNAGYLCLSSHTYST